MKFRRKTSKKEDDHLQMTPMIDVVFLLLIFFLLTFQIVAAEGDFTVQYAGNAPGRDFITPPLNIRMKANPDGSLQSLSFIGRKIEAPTDKAAFDQLQRQVMKQVGDPDGPSSKAPQHRVILDCDYPLDYRYVIDAITASTGKIVGSGPDVRVIKLVDKVEFAPKRELRN